MLFSEATIPMPLRLQERPEAVCGELRIQQGGITEKASGRADGQPGSGVGG